MAVNLRKGDEAIDSEVVLRYFKVIKIHLLHVYIIIRIPRSYVILRHAHKSRHVIRASFTGLMLPECDTSVSGFDSRQ